MWSLIWRVLPSDPAAHATWPDWFVPVARGLDVFQLSGGALSGVALVALGRGLRRIRRPRLVTRSLAVLVYVTLPVTLMLSAALMYGSNNSEGFFTHPLLIGVFLATSVSWSMQLYGAARCLRLTRREPVTPRASGPVAA